MMTFLMRIRTVSEANRRDHWATKARRVRLHRGLARLGMVAQLRDCKLTARALLSRSVAITLTRYAPRRLDDDNLASALKAIRDGIADAMETTDADERVTWRYAQERAKGYCVKVEIQ